MKVNELVTDDDLIKTGKSKYIGETIGKSFVYLAALLIIIATISITIFLASKGLQAFIKNNVSPKEFLTSTNWQPTAENPSFGAFPFIFGSLAVTMLAATIAGPLGISCALFMIEIAPKLGRKILQPIIELLVGIPSVVYGFIALSVLVPFLRQYTSGTGYSLIAGAIVLAVMILPTVTSIAMNAIDSLPSDLRDGSYALGATRFQTIMKVIIPAAAPSLWTAIVLGMTRAFGEALAVQMVIGNVRNMPESIFDPSATLTSIITLNMGHTTYGSIENNTLWSMGLVLLIISFVFILLIRYLSSRRKV